MPGYPTSCLSNAYMLLVPMLRRMARLPASPAHGPLPLARASSRRPGGTSSTRSGSKTARRVPAFKASGDITSMSHADGYIEIPAQTDIVEAGELVDVKLF